MSELTKLPNIAAKLKPQLADADITTAEELKRVGSREAWLRIQAHDPSPALCGCRRWRALSKASVGIILTMKQSHH